MGQLHSDTSKDEDNGDLVSSFTEYFKKINIENKIISQETIRLIELRLIECLLKKGNIQGAQSVICDALHIIDDVEINIAVTGEAGSGKSSFINALRGVGHEGKGAAKVGVVETTIERKPYKHPRIETLTLWELPGIGTMNFQPKDYLEKVKFQEYDFFVIVSATHFTKLELDLAKAIRFMKKNYYFVRTKVDMDLQNEKESKLHIFDRETVLQQTRSYCMNTFNQNNMDAPEIFLISNSNLSEYDLPVLTDTMIKDLPVQKRHKFMLSLPNITEAAIDRKRKSMQQTIWLEAFKAGTLATVPVVGIVKDNVEKLKKKLNHYRVLFGVDDESLEFMAKDSQVPVQQLKEMIKSPYLLDTKKEKTLGEMFLNCLEKFASASGGLLASGLYFRKAYYMYLLFLDTVTEDAKVVLRETLKKKSLVQTHLTHSY